jgi:hypothetical protein
MAYPRNSDNPLSQTTTYSGSDITVIAYRDAESPAIKFLKSKIKKEIRDIEESISQEVDRANEVYLQTAKKKEIANRLEAINAEAAEQQRLSNTLESFAKTDLMSTQSSGYSINYTQPSLAPESGLSFQKQTEDFQGYLNNQTIAFKEEADNEAETAYQESTEFIRSMTSKQEEKRKQLEELNKSMCVLGSLHTISYSSFREKFAVRSLGAVASKGYTHGPRTIAGTMVFNVLQSHELYKLADDLTQQEKGEEHKKSLHPGSVMLDQIEPFNLMLLFANEFGVYSSLHLFNVTIQTEGQSMSVDEVVTQNQMNFYALEMLPMTSLGNLFESSEQMISQLINEAKQAQKAANKNYRFKEISEPRFESILQTSSVQSQKEIDSMLKATRGLF